MLRFWFRALPAFAAAIGVAWLLTAADFQTINDGQGPNRVHGIGATYIPGSFPSPVGTTSTTCVMMGLGSAATITPVSTGRIHVDVIFNAFNTTGLDGILVGVKQGTGTAPVNGAALTGTDIGPACASGNYTWISPIASASTVINIGGNFTGATLGTPVWMDVSLAAVTGGTATVTKVKISAFEF